jgi:hypothetical protein
MRVSTVLLFTTVISVSLAQVGCAKNASERRAASPTMSERFSNDAITGRVNDVGAKYVSIKEHDGDSRRVRVDDNTKMDQVAVGDQVKAYVTEDGYASTIQRVVE